MWVQSVGREDPLEDDTAIHSSILAWRIPWTEESGGLHSMGSQRVRQFSSVQSLSCVQLFVTPWTAAGQAALSITNSRSLLKLMSIVSVMPSNHLILCHPLLLLPSVLASGSFPVSQFFASGGQTIGVSASASARLLSFKAYESC